MADNYAEIIENNLDRFFTEPPALPAEALPALQTENGFEFKAFGKTCVIRRDGIFLNSEKQTGVLGILISLYGLHANTAPQIIEPLKAFKEFPDSMPYAGAFVTHTQNILMPHVDNIRKNMDNIIHQLDGEAPSAFKNGDFSFMLRPLPKVSLGYIFYEADEDFPASVTCLYSHNAVSFLSIDALADVGEYTSKAILELLQY